MLLLSIRGRLDCNTGYYLLKAREIKGINFSQLHWECKKGIWPIHIVALVLLNIILTSPLSPICNANYEAFIIMNYETLLWSIMSAISLLSVVIKQSTLNREGCFQVGKISWKKQNGNLKLHILISARFRQRQRTREQQGTFAGGLVKISSQQST